MSEHTSSQNDNVDKAVIFLIQYCVKENTTNVDEEKCHYLSFFVGKCIKDITLSIEDIEKIKTELESLYIDQQLTNTNKLTEFSSVDKNNPNAVKFKEGFTNTNTKLRMLCYCLLYEYSKKEKDNMPSLMSYINDHFKEGALITDNNDSKTNNDLISNINILYKNVNNITGGKSHKSRRTRKHSKKNHRKTRRRKTHKRAVTNRKKSHLRP